MDNPEPTFSYEAAASMGSLVCTMPLSQMKKYLFGDSEVFVNVASVLGRSIECSSKVYQECVSNLAQLATSEDAFGETNTWNALDVKTLGVIVAGK